MSENLLRQHFAAGGNAIGGWCTTPSALNAEILAIEGFDYVCIDCQHGLVGYDSMVPMLASVSRTGVTPMVRVPFNDTPWMGQAFDAGAEAVIIPMVNGREDAERAAAACRYPPAGVRSFGPVRAGLYLNQAAPVEVNQQVMCFVMIETVEAVENADEICAAAGVDGVYVGPADLAISMGVAFGVDEMPQAHTDAVAHVAEVCADHRIIAGTHTGSGADARRAIESGFRMATVSTDAALFRQAAAAHLAEARGGDTGGSGRIY